MPKQRASRSCQISLPADDSPADACGSAPLRRTIHCATTMKVTIQVGGASSTAGVLARNLAAGSNNLLPENVLIEVAH